MCDPDRSGLTFPEIALDEAQGLLRTAYAEFRHEHYTSALQALQPVIDGGAKVSGDTGVLLALLWGVAGDTYWEMGRTDESLQAYRRSAEIDPIAGSTEVYGKHVADAQIREEAPHALACLQRAKVLRGKSRFGVCFLFCISMVLMPRTWWTMFFQIPKVESRLAKLIDQPPEHDVEGDNQPTLAADE